MNEYEQRMTENDLGLTSPEPVASGKLRNAALGALGLVSMTIGNPEAALAHETAPVPARPPHSEVPVTAEKSAAVLKVIEPAVQSFLATHHITVEKVGDVVSIRGFKRVDAATNELIDDELKSRRGTTQVKLGEDGLLRVTNVEHLPNGGLRFSEVRFVPVIPMDPESDLMLDGDIKTRETTPRTEITR